MTAFDPIPGRHPRLPVWAAHFRRSGWSLARVAALFNIDTIELTDAGVR
ncbi:hypothetical protein [Brevundimonas subvibrioides]|uniref:XRE family transcriptional regulator n=1 Tax=Brevundimonas subvibrioides (strain ATCC 15264 / DSM 4735 / LMG 14903 / NBRC 16000 / CB 81) TaxID=633149 RepID=D9QFV6_BRESC|nr:hypothetical protein [Brevundimonas subvibrioides]ADL00670.1 conserved hypothetical protein [Brevundimonas subvibrioides ATCC 15264]